MSDYEIDKLIEQFRLVTKHIHYDEAIVLGSIMGQLITEVKRLRDQEIKN